MLMGLCFPEEQIKHLGIIDDYAFSDEKRF